jgi:endonuclease/exonuclease/phosphatase family metal-dependent hydrolase
MAVKLKVCTFNLRVAVEGDGDNYFFNRTHRVLETIRTEKPDLIGFQEARDSQREWLRANLPDYTILGCGREKNYMGESVLAAFRTDAFSAIDFKQFWLSPTPSVAGSRFGADQSSCPRSTVAVTLKHRESDELLRFYNTHLDHKGAIARLLGATQLMQDIAAWGGKFVLTGDFNALPDAEEIKTITACPTLPIVDVTAELGGTFHSYGRLADPIKIDYIFTNADCDPAESYVVEDHPADGIYISDHNPVCGFITLA